MPAYMANAEPFFFTGNRVGCLLIHGFTGTPYEMRELGQRLSAQGYTVAGPVLAGHATCLADMAETRWTDWYASITTAYDRLCNQCESVFAIGLSLGGLLALHLAAHEPVKGVVAISTPFRVDNPLIGPLRAVPFLTKFIPYLRKNPKDDDTRDPEVRRKHPAYDSNPTRCAASLILDLIPHVEKELGKIRAPALLMQSRDDRTIAPDSVDRFNERIGSAERRIVWLKNSGHLVLEDYAKDQAFAEILHFVAAHLPSHIAPGLAESAATVPPAATNIGG